MEAKICVLFLALIIPTVTVTQSKRESKKQSSLLKYLKKLDDSYQVGKHKDIVLVLGMDDSDATALVSILTGAESESIQSGNDFRGANKQYSGTLKLITPNLMVDGDAEFGIAYYVCPSFSDLIDAKEELSRIFVLRKLLNSAKSVKFVITIPYELLENRQGFIELTLNLTNILNIGKYRYGIALVVTNVPSIQDESKDNANANAIEKIVNILKQIKNDLVALKMNNVVSVYVEKQSKFIINLIDILLEKCGNNYSRIGLMRRIDESRSLNNMLQLEDESAAISQIVNENLVYIRKSNDDIVYHVSNANENQALDMIKELQNEIIAEFAIISLDIKKFAMEQERENAKNLNKLIDTFDSIYGNISQINSIKPKVFKRQLIDAVNAVKIILSNENAKKFYRNIETLAFARTLLEKSDNKSDIPNEIMRKLANLIAYLSDFKSFYNFLDDLRGKLSQYVIQKQKRNYDGSRLMKLAINNDDVESKVIDLDIKSTIDSIDSNLYSQIEHLPINTMKLKQLQEVWNQSMLPISKHCSDDRKNLTVIGYNVMISDLFESICWPNATSIEILALNKIFFDEYIEKFSAYLSIIAPEWEIVSIDGLSFEKISVNGLNGQCLSPDFTNVILSFDGSPGGHFFGIGQRINDNLQLKINVAGGKGFPDTGGAPTTKCDNPGFAHYWTDKMDCYQKNNELTYPCKDGEKSPK